MDVVISRVPLSAKTSYFWLFRNNTDMSGRDKTELGHAEVHLKEKLVRRFS